jgi:hypothetical protein
MAEERFTDDREGADGERRRTEKRDGGELQWEKEQNCREQEEWWCLLCGMERKHFSYILNLGH